MALTKKRRNRFWYGYVAAMLVAYELPMLVFGYTMTGFLVAFPSIAILTLAFVLVMRRLSRM